MDPVPSCPICTHPRVAIPPDGKGQRGRVGQGILITFGVLVEWLRSTLQRILFQGLHGGASKPLGPFPPFLDCDDGSLRGCAAKHEITHLHDSHHAVLPAAVPRESIRGILVHGRLKGQLPRGKYLQEVYFAADRVGPSYEPRYHSF